MIPILFDSKAYVSSFATNGIGRLTECKYCKVKEALNGAYELELQYPITGKYFSNIANSMLIVVIPYDGCTSLQGFRIYDLEKTLDGFITVYAEHISYQRYWVPVMPFSASSLSDCLNKLRSYAIQEFPFTLTTDKTVTTGISFEEPKDLGTMLQGEEGSVLQTYRGEFEYDNYEIKLLNNRGRNNNVTLRYGKNIIDIAQETSIENTYTGICPYWKDMDGNIVTLPEEAIWADNYNNYPYRRTKVIDFSSDFEEQPTVAELRNRTKQYITANNIGYPSVNITVDFVALWQTKEYADIAPLERVKLGDTVTVYFEKLGISEQAKVIEYEYDVINERYNSIQIGDTKSTLSTTIANQATEIELSKVQNKKDLQSATDWLTHGNGYVVAVRNDDGSWKELLFLDKPTTKSATKVLRINENGIGFASGAAGTFDKWTYTQGWTLDGKLLIGGTNKVTISARNASGVEIFNVDSSGISWNASNSLMTKDGSMVLKNCKIQGFLQILDNNGDKAVFTVTDDDISWNDGKGYGGFKSSYIDGTYRCVTIYADEFKTSTSSDYLDVVSIVEKDDNYHNGAIRFYNKRGSIIGRIRKGEGEDLDGNETEGISIVGGAFIEQVDHVYVYDPNIDIENQQYEAYTGEMRLRTSSGWIDNVKVINGRIVRTSKD